MKYQTILSDKVQCEICPRRCKLSEGQRGFCYVRKNENNKIILETYGYNTGLAIDPIEKKPLYHFYPSSKVLSFGTLGCNMGCLFCQNWQTTKVKYPINQCKKVSPEQIVEIAKKYNCKSVAFTYNDPIIFFEYVIDTAKLCKIEGIKTVAVTSGYINIEPAKEFFNYMDAANIDLKGFSELFYQKNCMAHLKSVLDTIEYAVKETNCHVELTTLVIDGENDSYIKEECKWIRDNLGDNIPLHFSAFSPRYKYTHKSPTKFETLIKAYKIAQDFGLKYVYIGNVSNVETSTTFCKYCGKPIIIRDGYNILEYNINGNLCKSCNSQLDGIF